MICKCNFSFATLSQCVCPAAYDLAPDRVTCVERAEAEGVCHPMVVSPGMELKCTGGDPVGPEGTFPRGAICRGRCAVGYVADGRLKQKCRKDGAWSGSFGRCVAVSCPRLEVRISETSSETVIVERTMRHPDSL